MGPMAKERAPKFPFWLHQALEYLIGVLVAAQAIHADHLVWPIVAGGVMVLLAVTADGPIAAFRIVSRRAHRIADLVAAALLAIIAVVARDQGATVVGLVAASAVVLVVLVVRTDFRPKPTRAERRAAARPERGSGDGGTSDRIGRTAGRVAASGVRAARTFKARREQGR